MERHFSEYEPNGKHYMPSGDYWLNGVLYDQYDKPYAIVMEPTIDEPETLTPEWLLLHGFMQMGDGTYHRNEMATWRVEYSETERCGFWCTDVYPELGHRVYLPLRIENTDQLQTLFKLLYKVDIHPEHTMD